MKILGLSNPNCIESIAVQRRVVSIHMQNDGVGDRRFVPEVAQALREIAQALDDGLIGDEAVDFLKSSGGTEITMHGFSLFMGAREGANKSYGTRAFNGNPLILND